MLDFIKERTVKLGQLCVEKQATVRSIAKEFGISKSTVHKDLTERLPEINAQLAQEVKKVLEHHKEVRHIRGGEATRLKYRQKARWGKLVLKRDNILPLRRKKNTKGKVN
ncbi:MAG: sporulation transcriptional regulator SpoIIID [Bacillota bacterium]|jgi:putative DeoR family transcriptional regulator (stage III sporulation protein D)